MRTEKRIIGDLGEGVVCRYLKTKGYTILDQNYLKKWGEIDIIARKGNKLHFIEVKSKQKEYKDWDLESSYRPEENVHEKKLKRLWRTLESYLLEKNVSEDTEWQIDVYTVYLDVPLRKAKVEYIENIIV